MGGRRVLLAEFSIELDAHDARALEQLVWFFGSLPATERPVDVRLRVSDEAPPCPPRTPDVVDGPVASWEEGGSLALRHEEGLTAAVTAPEIVIGRWNADRPRPLRQLLGSGLAAWLGDRGVMTIHGALIERDGVGLTALGPTGSGKSTLAIAALSAGWHVQGDDLALVRRGPDDTLLAHGLPKPMAVDPTLISALGSFGGALDDDPRGRAIVPASLLSVGWVPLRALVVVAHSPDDDGSMRPIGHSDKLTAVFSSTFEAIRRSGRRRDLACLAALSALPGFRLEHARDRARRAERAVSMLEGIWTELDTPVGPPAEVR